jgi:hypothetical protein
MGCDSTLVLNPGQDFRSRNKVFDDAGEVDLTGKTVSVHDVTDNLTGAVAVSIVAGELQIDLTWQPGWAALVGLLGGFRILILDDAAKTGSFAVDVMINAAVTDVEVARGSDLTVALTWPDDRDGADLSGDTIDIFNVSPGLTGIVSVAVFNSVTREVRWSVEGDPGMALGDLGSFQLRRSTGGTNRRTLSPIRIICA